MVREILSNEQSAIPVTEELSEPGMFWTAFHYSSHYG